MDEATKALAEAMFRGRYSNPQADSVERAWIAAESMEGYRAEIVRGLLRDLGYAVVATRVLDPDQ